MIIRDNLENQCLYRIQVDKRLARGNIVETKCSSCKGYDLYCSDYLPLKTQRQLVNHLSEVGVLV